MSSHAALCVRRQVRSTLAASFLAITPLVGQRVVSAPPQRGQGLQPVTMAAANEVVSCAASQQHGVTPARNGPLFVLVTRTVFADGSRKGAATSDLEMWRSDDGGASWRHAASAPTSGDADGSLVAVGEGLAVAWTAHDGAPWSSVHWQRYDVAADRWIGKPECLAPGRADEDQYFCPDLVCTSNGSLVVAIGSHRSPPSPPWNCGWSTGMRCLPAASSEWSPLAQVNVNSYGVAGNMLARGDVVDFVYRTNPRRAMHGLRSFDAREGEFVQATEDCAMAAPGEGAEIANTGILCGDDTGGRTLLHVLAGNEPGTGRLAVSHARPGNDWKTVDLAVDEPLVAGNENPQHFTLARGPGNQVFVYFSKQSEQFAHLWQCTIEDGLPAMAPRRVASGDPMAFVVVSGMRAANCFSGLHVVTLGRTAKQPGGVISVFGSWPSRTAWSDRPRQPAK